MEIEKIWNNYRSQLKAFLHSRVSNEDDVDDLLQEILIKSYNKMDSIKDASSIKAWLYQIANHTIIDFYRKKAKNSNLASDDLWYAGDEADSPLKDLEQCLEPFINQLPDEYAEILMAVDIDGLSQKDYAEQHDIKYSTFKSRVNKGRELLQQQFIACCEFSTDSQGNILDYNKKNKINIKK